MKFVQLFMPTLQTTVDTTNLIKIDPRWRSTKNMKTTIWEITFEVVETSSWLQNVPYRRAYSGHGLGVLSYDVTFLRYVTSKKTYDFFHFSKIVNFQLMLLKIGTHIDWTCIVYRAKKCIDQNNATYVSMATKNPIMQNREFFNIQYIR